MKALRYHIYLKQPLLATILQGEPNSSVSADYIPGSLIRGMCIGKHLKTNPDIEDPSADPVIRRLFFSDETRYLNAYPLTDNQQRSLPTPRSLLVPKNKQPSDSATTAYDAGNTEWDEDTMRETERERLDSLKPITQPFCTISDETLSLYKPARSIKVHTQRDRKKGRSQKDSGAVFQYDALEQGQTFEGIILIDDDDDVPTIQKLIQEGVAWLGRSRSANYGKVYIDNIHIDAHWREIEQNSLKGIQLGKRYTLTFLSNTLLHDNAGKPVTALDDVTLSEYLGVSVEIDRQHTFTTASLVGGFNRTWQLPINQSYVISAGSIVSFTALGELAKEKVQVLEQQGIGYRRAEGFGRIAFNWLDEEEYKAREGTLATRNETNPQIVVDSTATKLAQKMANRLFETKIQQGIVKFVKDHVKEDQMPENSQLSRVRMMIRQVLPTGNTTALLTNIKAFRSPAMMAFEKARIEECKFLDWMTDLLNQPENVWQKIGILTHDIPTIAEVRATYDTTFERKVTLRLLEAILVAPVYQRKKREGQTL